MLRHSPLRFLAAVLTVCLAVTLIPAGPARADNLTEEDKEALYNGAIAELENWLEKPQANPDTAPLDKCILTFRELMGYKYSSEFCNNYIPLLKYSVLEEFSFYSESIIVMFEKGNERIAKYKDYLEGLDNSPIQTVPALVAYARGREAQSLGNTDAAMDYYGQCYGYYDSRERYDTLYTAKCRGYYDRGVAFMNDGKLVEAYFCFAQAGKYSDSTDKMQFIVDTIGHVPEQGEVWPPVTAPPAPEPEPEPQLSEEELLHASGQHIPVTDPGRPATCTEDGITDGSHCSYCGAVLQPQQAIPALGHDWDSGAVIQPADCFNEGLRVYTCRRCGARRDEAYRLEIKLGRTGWVHNADGTWAYGGEDGNALLGPQVIDGKMYCFGENGILISGWAKVSGKWFYAKSDSTLCYGGWAEVDGEWYYFYGNGEMATGWLNDGGTYYYLDGSGHCWKGWLEYKENWYYLDDEGKMVIGWMKGGEGEWYFFQEGGELALGWFRDTFEEAKLPADRKEEMWFRSNKGNDKEGVRKGAMITGWFRDVEAEARMDPGHRREMWYYLDEETGRMVTGPTLIDGKWEIFDEGGLWLYTSD